MAKKKEATKEQPRSHKIELVASIEKAKELISIISKRGAVALNLPPAPLSSLIDFLDGKRDTIWEITINKEVYLTVTGDREAVKAVIVLIKAAGMDKFEMDPLLLSNLNDFVDGKRTNVLQFDMEYDPEGIPVKEELIGHL